MRLSISINLAIYLGFGLPIAWIDLRTHRIPNRLSAALALGLIFTSLLSNFSLTSLSHPAESALLLSGALLLLYLAIPGSIGAGDIKLAFSVGWFSYRSPALITLAIAAILGLAYGLLVAARSGARSRYIPFAPFLLLAGLASFWN